jgi:beta-mannosidase
VAPIRHDGRTEVFLVSDRTAPLDAQLRTRVMDMDGRLLHEHLDNVRVPALGSTPAAEATDAALLQGADPYRSFAVFELLAQGRSVSRHLLYFAPALRLQLPDPGLHAGLADSGHGIVLNVHAQRLAREVWVDFGSLDAQVSDNAFDLLPGEGVELQITGTASITSLRNALQVRSLVDATVRAAITPELAKP